MPVSPPVRSAANAEGRPGAEAIILEVRSESGTLNFKNAQNEIMKLDDATAEEVEHYRRKIKKKAIR
jgi:hypothetical protein